MVKHLSLLSGGDKGEVNFLAAQMYHPGQRDKGEARRVQKGHLPWWIGIPASVGFTLMGVVAPTFLPVWVQACLFAAGGLAVLWSIVAGAWHFRPKARRERAGVYLIGEGVEHMKVGWASSPFKTAFFPLEPPERGNSRLSKQIDAWLDRVGTRDRAVSQITAAAEDRLERTKRRIAYAEQAKRRGGASFHSWLKKVESDSQGVSRGVLGDLRELAGSSLSQVEFKAYCAALDELEELSLASKLAVGASLTPDHIFRNYLSRATKAEAALENLLRLLAGTGSGTNGQPASQEVVHRTEPDAIGNALRAKG